MNDPSGSTSPLLRYVVLRHEGVAEPHFDIMFETAPGSALATWRSSQWPLHTGTPLVLLSNHRPAYLTYEGELSRDRGSVRRIASGHHRVLEDGPVLLIVALEEDGSVLRLFRGA